MDPEDELKQKITREYGYDVSNEYVSGNLNIYTWKTMFMILHVTTTIPPVYATIMVLRRGILKKLSAESTMSENTRQLHAQLLKTLMYQSCLPIFFAAAGSSYALGQFNIIHSPKSLDSFSTEVGPSGGR
ncbi:hypothetical protein OESDEN_11912 [Oesophagostomum dentatum]|uniref:Uncharacterized protein n=1 Tax=Oesophagostomum dentatum TaxID=61180 RepID=A0A0B1SXP9_OESDE|nr:hypothetical protein OESDEN_11912 [Oesophagostomum dentatum]